MVFVSLDFSYSNPVLAPLVDLEPPADKTNLDIKLKDLPSHMADPLAAMYKALTNKEAKLDTVVFRLVFKDGRAPKLYAPALYQFGNNLVLRWGKEQIKFVVTKGALDLVDNTALAGTDATLDTSFAEAQVGKYSESVLELILNDFEGYDEIVMPITVKRANYDEAFEGNKAKQYLKKGNAKELLAMFAELKTGSGGGVTGDVFGNDILPQGVDIVLINAVARETQFGTNYIITAQANLEIGLDANVNFWGFSKVKQKLNKGAVINKDHPAVLNFVKTTNDKGDIRYNIKLSVYWPETENSIKLSNILANWS